MLNLLEGGRNPLGAGGKAAAHWLPLRCLEECVPYETDALGPATQLGRGEAITRSRCRLWEALLSCTLPGPRNYLRQVSYGTCSALPPGESPALILQCKASWHEDSSPKGCYFCHRSESVWSGHEDHS